MYMNQEGNLLYCWAGWSVGDTSDAVGDITDIRCGESAGLWPPQAAEWEYSGEGAWRDVVTVTTVFPVTDLRLLL